MRGFLNSHWPVWILLLGVGFAIYSQTLHYEFHFDSTTILFKESPVTDFRNFSDPDQWALMKRPVSQLSFALNHWLDGTDPVGYRLFNILIHCLNAALVYYFIFLLLNSNGFRKPAGTPADRRWFALLASLIFLVHPLQVQSVTYVIQRMTSLSATFYLVSVLFYFKARTHQIINPRSATSWILLSLAAFAGLLALFSKQSAASLPLAFILVELCFIRNKEGRPAVKYILTAAGLMVVVILSLLVSNLMPRETAEITRNEYLLTQSRVLMKYIQLMILPVQLNLDYDFSLSVTFWDLRVLASIAGLTGLLLLAVWLFNRSRLASFSILWFFATLSVESSLIPIADVINEHRCYLPLMGFAVILTEGMFRLLSPFRKGYVIVALSVIVVIFGAISVNRNKVWSSGYTLWKDVVSKSPEKARPWNNLGYVTLTYRKDYDEAIGYLRNAIRIDTGYDQAYNNLGMAYRMKGNLPEAAKFFSIAASKSDKSGIFNNAGCAFLEINEPEKAIVYLMAAYKERSHDPELLCNLGIAYQAKKDTVSALNFFQLALAEDPQSIKALNWTGLLYYASKKPEMALLYLKQSVLINPGDPMVWTALGNCYFLTGKLDEAAISYRKALTLSPENKEARNNLQRILDQKRDNE